MNKTRYTKDIIIYENFLTQEECQNVIKLLNKHASSNKISWTPISFYESYSSILPQDDDPDLLDFNLPLNFFSNLKNRIVDAVASVHDLNPSIITEVGYHTQKWEPGAYARIHSDNTDEHGNSGPFARSKYAAFLYLNDDFDGGILKFPKQDLEIKPSIGMLAAFDGGFNNMHEVTVIKNGVRYTIGSFWDNRKESDYPEEIRLAWKEEMERVREKQKAQKEEWQNTLKDGYKIDAFGNKYKIGEL
jgi:hypothetical protein